MAEAKPAMRLDGKVALITGGGTGIGRGIACAFARAGARVAVSGRRPSPLEETVERIAAAGSEGLAVSADLATPDGPARMVSETAERFGALDILVNNAGIYRRGATLETSEALWDQLFAVNLRGPWRLCREAVARFRQAGRPGAIVNVASTAGYNPVPGIGVYVLTKAALIMLTRQLAAELAAERIRVNCICPGIVDTPIFETVMPAEEAERFKRDIAPNLHPLGRIGTPEDIAGAALYLVSDAAQWVTGVVLPVSGGAA